MNVSALIGTRNRPNSIQSAVVSVLANSYLSFDLLVCRLSDGTATEELVR
jgi:hypothetical protein